jgi:hypothetical protein
MKKLYLIFILLFIELHADVDVFIMAGQSNSSRMNPKMLKNKIRKKFPNSILFKYDKEGSNLHKQWYGDGTAYSKDDGELYKKFQSKWKVFLNELKQKNPHQKINLQGLFWMQGESDGWRKKSSESYYKNLKKFLQDLRITLKRENLPIVIGRLSNGQTAVPFLSNIRTAQNKMALLKNTALANLDNIPCYDNLHFKGYYKLVAKRFVTAMYHLKNKKKSYTLSCCAGGNLNLTYTQYSQLNIRFKSAKKGTRYAPLKQGECSWIDRAFRANEPQKICQSNVNDVVFKTTKQRIKISSKKAPYISKIKSGGIFSLKVYNNNHGCMVVTKTLF